jgi:hypothetical protein
VETPQYQCDQERSEQKQSTFIIKVSERDGLRQNHSNPSRRQIQAFKNKQQKRKHNTAEHSGDPMQRRAQEGPSGVDEQVSQVV